ncbi:MAG: hypothetical protein U0992_20170 [Planctomycetaceae bacterium]
MDYLAAMNMNLGMALAYEKLIGLEVPEKGVMTLRVIIAELGRIASHLVGMGRMGWTSGRSARSCTRSASARSSSTCLRKPAAHG